MEGNYVETSVVRNKRYIDLLFRIIWIGVIVWGTFLLFPINGMIVFLYLGLHGTLIYFFWNNYKVMYEYIYCDGQIDFDLIINDQKRKHKLRIQPEDVVYMAKPEHEQIIKNKDIHTTLKYISSMESGKIYALIVKKQDKYIKILFEPNSKMLSNIKYKLKNKCDIREVDLLEDEE